MKVDDITGEVAIALLVAMNELHGEGELPEDMPRRLAGSLAVGVTPIGLTMFDEKDYQRTQRRVAAVCWCMRAGYGNLYKNTGFACVFERALQNVWDAELNDRSRQQFEGLEPLPPTS